MVGPSATIAQEPAPFMLFVPDAVQFAQAPRLTVKAVLPSPIVIVPPASAVPLFVTCPMLTVCVIPALDVYQLEGIPVKVKDVEVLVPAKHGIRITTIDPIRVAYAVPVGDPLIPFAVIVKLVSP